MSVTVQAQPDMHIIPRCIQLNHRCQVLERLNIIQRAFILLFSWTRPSCGSIGRLSPLFVIHSKRVSMTFHMMHHCRSCGLTHSAEFVQHSIDHYELKPMIGIDIDCWLLSWIGITRQQSESIGCWWVTGHESTGKTVVTIYAFTHLHIHFRSHCNSKYSHASRHHAAACLVQPIESRDFDSSSIHICIDIMWSSQAQLVLGIGSNQGSASLKSYVIIHSMCLAID